MPLLILRWTTEAARVQARSTVATSPFCMSKCHPKWKMGQWSWDNPLFQRYRPVENHVQGRSLTQIHFLAAREQHGG